MRAKTINEKYRELPGVIDAVIQLDPEIKERFEIPEWALRYDGVNAPEAAIYVERGEVGDVDQSFQGEKVVIIYIDESDEWPSYIATKANNLNDENLNEETVNFERGEDPRRTMGLSEEPAEWSIYVAVREVSTNIELPHKLSSEVKNDVDDILIKIFEDEGVELEDLVGADLYFIRNDDWNDDIDVETLIQEQFPGSTIGEAWTKWWTKNMGSDIENEIRERIKKWEYLLPPGELKEMIEKILK